MKTKPSVKRFVSAALAGLMAGNVLLAAAAAPKLPFTDVAEDAWYAVPVEYCYEHAIMKGVSADRFDPDSSVTRAMYVQMLANMTHAELKEKPVTSFADVAADEWYAPAVAWAKENQVSAGFPDGSFHPDDPVTREEMAAFIVNYVSKLGADLPVSEGAAAFSDSDRISTWAAASVEYCRIHGLMKGNNGAFRPGDFVCRAEGAAAFRVLNETISALTPEPSENPIPTPSESPDPSETPEPSETPSVTPTPTPSETPEPSEPVETTPATPSVSPTPTPSETPESSTPVETTPATPTPTPTPEPSEAPTPEPEPEPSVPVTKTYTVTFNNNESYIGDLWLKRYEDVLELSAEELGYKNGTETVETYSVAHNFTALMTKQEYLKKFGCGNDFYNMFVTTGWYLDSACTHKFDFSTPITSDITLYLGLDWADGWSNWVNWNVKVNNNLSAVAPNISDSQSHDVIKGSGLDYLSKLDDYEKQCAANTTEYTTTGWYTDVFCTIPFDRTADVNDRLEVTLYLGWEDSNGNNVLLTPNEVNSMSIGGKEYFIGMTVDNLLKTAGQPTETLASVYPDETYYVFNADDYVGFFVATVRNNFVVGIDTTSADFVYNGIHCGDYIGSESKVTNLYLEGFVAPNGGWTGVGTGNAGFASVHSLLFHDNPDWIIYDLGMDYLETANKNGLMANEDRMFWHFLNGYRVQNNMNTLVLLHKIAPNTRCGSGDTWGIGAITGYLRTSNFISHYGYTSYYFNQWTEILVRHNFSPTLDLLGDTVYFHADYFYPVQ